MVVPRISEYRRSFEPKLEIYTPIYESNYDFRKAKRKTEDSHDTNPFCWEPSDEELEYEAIYRSAHPVNIPPHMYKHALLNHAYKQKITPRRTIVSVPVVVNDDNANKRDDNLKEELKIDIPESEQHSSEKSVDQASSLEKDTEQPEKQKSSCNMVSLKICKPRKPANKKPLPKPRPVSSFVGRPLKKKNPAIQEEEAHPPFVAYGSLDQERETANKRTHNIRASCEIYPAALRALKRRQYDIERKKKQAESASQRVRKRNYFDEKMTRDTSAWETEYRHCFVAFDENTYRAGLSARVIPRCSTA